MSIVHPELPNPKQKTMLERAFEVIQEAKIKYQNLEATFNENCQFFQGRIKFDINQLYITIVYWSVFFSTIPSHSIIENSKFAENDTRAAIAKILPLLTFLYTIFCQICQQNKNLYIWIILFIFIFLTPLLVLIDYHLNLLNTYQQQSEDYVGIAFCILTILIFLHSLINSFILTYVAKTTTKLIASLSSCSFCLLIPYGIIFQIICFILLIDSPEEYEIINSIKDIIAAPVFFTLFLVSIFVLKNIFKAQRFNYNYIQQQPPQEIYQQYQNYRWSLNIQSIFSRLKIRYISLILIIIAYIILELYCYGGLIHEMSQTNVDYQMIITFSFLIIAIPIYLILVEQIGFKDYETSSLNFWVPILLGGLSTFITVKIWEITETNSYISSISRLIGICPLLISLIQLTVGFLKSNRQNQKMFIMAISCYFFAFPLGLLLTLSDAFNDYSIAISAYTLMGIGLIPFVLVVLYYLFVIGIYLFKLPSQAVNLNFAPYKYLDLTNYAFWLNSIGYIISFHFTCFYVWNEPESATGTKKGTLQGLMVLHTLLFVVTHYALKTLSNNSEQDQPQLTLNQDSQTITAGIVFPFIILLPISLSSENETTKTALLACAVGVPLVFLYLRFLLFIKKEATNYRRFFLPLIVTIDWIIFIGPIGVLFPILADYYENQSQEFSYFAQLAIAYTILIIIIVVTCVAIFYLVLLNKDYMEMKRRTVLRAVMQLFANYKIYASEEICSLIFLQYKKNDEQFKESVKNGDPVNIVNYVDGQFKKKLVTKKEYDYDCQLQLANDVQLVRQQSVIQRPKQINRILDLLKKIQDFLLQLLFCSYGTVKLQEQEELKDERERELMQLNQWRDSQLNQNQDPQYGVFLNTLFREIFYNELRLNQEKTEVFWYCIYEHMKNDLTRFFSLCNLRVDQEVLRQYRSCRVGREIVMDIKDFAQLLKDNISEGEQLNYNYLWKLALQKYPIFVFNQPILKARMLQTRIRGSQFSSQNFIREGEIQPVNRRLPPQNQQLVQAVQQDYTLRINKIQERYDRSRPSQTKVTFWKIIHKIHEFLWIKPRQYSNKIQNQLSSQFQLELPIAVPQRGQEMEESKWDVISVGICNKLIEKCNEFDRVKNQERFRWRNTTTNILALILRLVDLYGLVSLAFNYQVGWFGQRQDIAPVEIIDYSYFWSQYNFQFFLAFFLSLTYIYIGVQVKVQIENDTFGLENGQIANYRHKTFWLSKAINLISGQFIFVMKTYIDAFICDYNHYPYILIRQHSIECMSDLHFMYVVFAIIGCGIYYPLSTFLQPTFQYNDKSLDLKYKSSYLVLYIQSKLLILGLSSVFSNLQSESYLYQMLFSSFVMLGLIIVYYKMRPCYVEAFNDIEICFLIIILLVLSVIFQFYFGAFLIIASKSIWSGWVIVIIFGCATLFITGYKIHVNNPKFLQGIGERVKRLFRR